jgi:RNase adaptor protein for sRNA GlmZ degradation
MTTITLISFGYLRGAAATAERVVDVRDTVRDPAIPPYADPLDLDGRDEPVRRAVLTTSGALPLVFDLAADALELPADQPRRIAIGCAGGRHRSVALAEAVADVLRAVGNRVIVDHRHIQLPRALPGGESQ